MEAFQVKWSGTKDRSARGYADAPVSVCWKVMETLILLSNTEMVLRKCSGHRSCSLEILFKSTEISPIRTSPDSEPFEARGDTWTFSPASCPSSSSCFLCSLLRVKANSGWHFGMCGTVANSLLGWGKATNPHNMSSRTFSEVQTSNW